MTTIRTWSADECIEKIDALEAKRDALVDLPRSGSIGNTTLSLDGKRDDIERELAEWRIRLQAARSCTRIAQRVRWGG